MEVAQRHDLLQDFQDKHTINKISTWHDIFVEKTCFFLSNCFLWRNIPAIVVLSHVGF